MSKFWAEVPLGKLQTENRLPKDYSGEYFVRIKPNLRYKPVQAFNVHLSAWVNGRKSLEYCQISLLYFEALEVARRQPEILLKSGRLLYYVSQYGLDVLLSKPKWFREQLIALNNSFGSILLSPRSIGSEAHKRLLDLHFKQVISPGREKSSFPEVAYIGVGYRDKGHCRKKELDATPSWQELAMATNVKLQPEETKLLQRNRTANMISSENWKELRRRQIRKVRKLSRQESSLLY